MLKFTEPEEEYKTEKCLKKNNQTKINLLLFLIFLSGVLLFAVQTDLVSYFEKKEIFEEICEERYEYIRVDEEQIKLEKARNVLSDNLESFKEMPGYQESSVRMEKNFHELTAPNIYIFFDGDYQENRIIPKSLCGYQVVTKIK
jgi:hypothetical protein